jgi:short-subunit dehydrogenase
VNNIGFVKTMPFLETDEAFWQQSIELNLTVGLRFCHLVLPHMIKQQCGNVVNISSIAGRNPRPMALLYSVTKAGVIAVSLKSSILSD